MLIFIGKLMLLTVYLWSALWNKTVNFRHVRGKAAEAGLPFPGAALVAASLLEIVASIIILFPQIGGRTTYVAAALAMAVYTMIAAAFFHPFWRQAGAMRANNQINFLKNIGLAGAFLLLIA